MADPNHQADLAWITEVAAGIPPGWQPNPAEQAALANAAHAVEPWRPAAQAERGICAWLIANDPDTYTELMHGRPVQRTRVNTDAASRLTQRTSTAR